MTVQIRKADISDSARIFEWRNDPITAATSRSQSGVDWLNHQRWFPAQLEQADTHCLIGEVEGGPCGVVWFRKNRGNVWETSVNLAPGFRGKKLSVPLLAEAMKLMCLREAACYFSTEVQDSNVASIKMFERCGFVYIHPSPGFGTYCTL